MEKEDILMLYIRDVTEDKYFIATNKIIETMINTKTFSTPNEVELALEKLSIAGKITKSAGLYGFNEKWAPVTP